MIKALLMLVAVETSDLVGSTQLSEKQLNSAIKGLKVLFANITQAKHGRAEIYRGDGFQVMYSQPALAVKYLILTKLFLRFNFDALINVTQSLAIGHIDDVDGPLSEKMSDVFIKSGRQLDSQSKGEIQVQSDYISADFMLATQFLNRLISELTKKQAETLYWYIQMDYPEQQSIAEHLNMTRQNVNTHLHRANADLVRAYIKHYTLNIQEQL